MDSVSSLILKQRKLQRRRGRTLDETDELIQEAFLRLQIYRRERHAKEPEAFLARIVQNLHVDYLRRRGNRGTHGEVYSVRIHLIAPKLSPVEVPAAQQRLQRL